MSAKPASKSSPARRKVVPSRGQANLARLGRTTEAEIRRTSPPELRDLPADFWDSAVPVVPEAKVPISLRVDSDVLAWFRENGPRYQSRMNAVLRSYMERASSAAPKQSKRRVAKAKRAQLRDERHITEYHLQAKTVTSYEP